MVKWGVIEFFQLRRNIFKQIIQFKEIVSCIYAYNSLLIVNKNKYQKRITFRI